MTEALAPSAKSSNVASSTPDTMEWDSRARRMVMIYLPLSCFVLILLFPFYWMAITSFKPNAELLNYKAHNPFWISSPTLAHIKHRDVVLQTAVVVLAASMIELSRVGGWLQRALLFVLGPLAAACVHVLLSPKREYEADRRAAELCDSPHGLADALLRLEQASELVAFEASPATEPLWPFNPFMVQGLAALFVTHPKVDERVKRLRALDTSQAAA